MNRAETKPIPLISIITVVKNAESLIEETILSVLNQTYDNIEYIVIDGNSSDNTVKILKKYNKAITFWTSKEDRGIYYAMNYGISVSSGEFVGILNAGDIFYPDAIKNLFQGNQNISFDYTFGSIAIESAQRVHIKVFSPILTLPDSFDELVLMPAPHMSVFIRKDVFNEIGFYDTSFLLSADFDLLLRLMKYSKKVFIFTDVIGAFRLGGISGSYGTHIENFRIFRKHKFPLIKSSIHTMACIFKAAFKKIF